MKRFKLPLTLMMVALMGLMMISCQGESKEAKDEARAALEGEPAAVPTAENAILPQLPMHLLVLRLLLILLRPSMTTVSLSKERK